MAAKSKIQHCLAVVLVFFFVSMQRNLIQQQTIRRLLFSSASYHEDYFPAALHENAATIHNLASLKGMIIQHPHHKNKTTILDHPREGARDEVGRYAYVHDERILKKNPQWNWTISATEHDDVCAKPVGDGPEGGGKQLAQQVFDRIRVARHVKNNDVTIFCAVYTYPGHNDLTDAIRMTWGQRCDGFLASSTETNRSGGTVNIPHYGEHQGRYEGIWQKVRSMISYFYDNFIDSYDYFFLSGDDTFLIVENLKKFLTGSNFSADEKPLYLGNWVHPTWLQNQFGSDFYYNGGGSGYVLNRCTIRALVETVFPICHKTTDKSAEDLYMGECLSKVLNVTGYDTRDKQGNDRFLGVDVMRQAMLQPRQKIRKPESYHRFLWTQLEWRCLKHGWTPKFGPETISRELVSFHMVKTPEAMKRYHVLIYDEDKEARCSEHFR